MQPLYRIRRAPIVPNQAQWGYIWSVQRMVSRFVIEYWQFETWEEAMLFVEGELSS